jgi:polysaccharide export outer membrane protein
VIEEGDTVQVSLVNVSTEGFLDFTQSAISPISLTPLPPQTVSADGRINIPGLGRVRAEGLSPDRLERALTEALSEVLVDPSVVVQVTDRQSARATIVGDVAEPGSKPILRRNLRLVELIGLAGGQSAAAEDLVVSFVRGDREVRLPLTTVLTEPEANIRVHPGDLISVERSRRAYVIRGAVTLPGRYEFIEPELTLEEAIGLARGILNRRASRNGVFLYRTMPKARLARLGADIAEFDAEQVPTIFHFDYRVPTTIFAAQSFTMRSGDVVFVSDHIIEEISKIFGIFTTVVPVQSFIPAPVE